ncbi:hypothetical protein PV677_36040 [Streptomyces sp. DE06-01C]|uniref:hypothetical protein n=1 Tax=Streptomyces sp. DE06-01C TaxID=3028656 RepID=UPI0029C237FB|nr:hypothetical protein [Streptomyces sp. DE06-01C]MDX5526082.1 hypothetical protein [Streptomyces sp. DE06-01C]
MTARKTAAPTPPAAAVAADAHWAATRERLMARARPVLKLTICDDDEAKQALQLAREAEWQAKSKAERAPDDEAAQAALRDAAAALDDAQAAFDAVSIPLRFQALDRKTYKELLAAHRPTEEQAEDGYDFNLETLAPILIAASSLDGITEDDATTFLDTWSKAEAEALLNTAFGVQREDRMDLGKG